MPREAVGAVREAVVEGMGAVLMMNQNSVTVKTDGRWL